MSHTSTSAASNRGTENKAIATPLINPRLFRKVPVVEERKELISSNEPPNYSDSNVGRESGRGWHGRWKLMPSIGRGQAADPQSVWKPITLRAPILGGFIATSLSLLIILEILAHISQRPENATGLVFAADIKELSKTANFIFSYLPTTLAVIYSMMWNWVDLDVKRLEPWFQLSRTHGASAKDSLLLEYPFDFLPFIPIKAVRRKHWGVFFAGTTMLLVLYIITPLQSAIFSKGSVTRHISTVMGTSAALVPSITQTTALNTNFMNTAYGIAWLGQQLPTFTMNDFAILPFQPVAKPTSSLPTELWSTNVEAFYTNLTCSPAEVQYEPLGYTFSNGRGCVVPEIVLVDTAGNASYFVTYIGYYDNPQNDWSLQNPNCSVDFSNNFLALWASGASHLPGSSGVYTNLTALFCETSYSSQVIDVAVNASNYAIHHFQAVSQNETKTDLANIFNITNFEYLVGAGVPSTDERQDYAETIILEQDPRIQEYNITFPNSNMVGFAVALNSLPIDSWSQPTVLQQAFQKAHQLLFMTAFSTLRTSTASLNDIRPGLREDNPAAIIFSRTISIIVEAAFAVIIVFTASLWYYSYHRASHLKFDPASVADIMSMLHPDAEMLSDFHDDGTLTMTELEDHLSNQKYRLLKPEDDGLYPVIERILGSPRLRSFQLRAGDRSTRTTSQKNEDFKPSQSLELNLIVGSIFVIIILIAIATLIRLNILSLANNGIQLPSENIIVRSIIENYAPTMLANLIEPMWTMLNRLLCLLQPFEELRRGRAAASSSILVKYTSVPPQLAFWRALKARNFLLAVVCIVAVSSNVLAVALAAFLNENDVTVEIPFNSTFQLSPVFNGNSLYEFGDASVSILYFDHFYIALSNISQGNSLPVWTDQEFYYIPFDTKSGSLTTIPEASLQSYRGKTTGFGVNVTCNEVTASDANNQLEFDVSQNGSRILFSTSYTFANGSKVTCFHPRGHAPIQSPELDPIDDIFPFTDGPSALESVQPMAAGTNVSDDGFCSQSLNIGWARAGAESSDSISNTSIATNRTISETFLTCTQTLLTAQFEVTVDVDGRVIESIRVSDFSNDTSSLFTANSSAQTYDEITLFQQATQMIAPPTVDDFAWHNDSFSSDWVNFLLGKMLNSTSLVDPASPVPDAAMIAPYVEKLYTELFAILLSLNPNMFETSSSPFTAQAVYTEVRLFVNPLMFELATIILGFHLVVALWYYANRPKRFLPRMPTSIASIIAFVAASRALQDFNGDKESRDNKDGEEDGEKDREKDEDERRYGYGAFVGTDGRTKVGIEKQRFVVPLEVRNPHVKRRRWWLRMGKGGEGEVKSWI